MAAFLRSLTYPNLVKSSGGLMVKALALEASECEFESHPGDQFNQANVALRDNLHR